jgi:cell division protein ZapA
MPLVNVMINGKAYTLGCDEGEEQHLKDLAAVVDAKAREALGMIGQQAGDAKMMLMAALLLADEHHEISTKLAQGSEAVSLEAQEKQNLHLKAEKAESLAADALEAASKKIEDIAARLMRA